MLTLNIFGQEEVQCPKFDHTVTAFPWHGSRNGWVIFNPLYTLITIFGL